jgi:hypothetical protein
MIKYYTKRFESSVDIDQWLRDMTRPELTASEGRDVKIEGYVSYKNYIVITISRWEMQK